MMGCYSLATTHDISPILSHVVADSTWSHIYIQTDLVFVCCQCVVQWEMLM